MLNTLQDNLVSVLEGKNVKESLPTAIQFSEQVEEYALDYHCTIIEAMREMVEVHNLDIHDIPKLITAALKQKLGVEQGFIKVEQGLPLG